MQGSLFNTELPQDNSPADGTDIHQVCLYFSTEQKKQVAELTKKMIRMGYAENPSELFLVLLKAGDVFYDAVYKKFLENGDIKTEESPDGQESADSEE